MASECGLRKSFDMMEINATQEGEVSSELEVHSFKVVMGAGDF